MLETAGQTAYVPFLRQSSHARRKPRFFPSWGAKRRSAVIGIAALLLTVGCVIATHWLWSQKTSILKMQRESVSSLRAAVLGLQGQDELYLDRAADISSWTIDDIANEFTMFATQYKKTYEHEAERKRRQAIFHKNLIYIQVHNEQNFTFSLRMNEFGDLTDDEFRSHYVSMRMKEARRAGRLKAGAQRPIAWHLQDVGEETLPAHVDWREKGCVTEVKNQKQCGSCWAFSTTGAMEGAICAQTGVLPDLSEQQLVDCASPEGNEGCNGGEADWGFQYVIDSGGLCREEDYPYFARELGECAADECEAVSSIKAFQDVPPESDKALRAAIVKHGPVSVAIEADQKPFQFYDSGVFNSPCGTALDHAVLVVGYGTDEETGMDYYIMKNSWGSEWGEDGYMRVSRSVHHTNTTKGNVGECGILMASSFALP